MTVSTQTGRLKEEVTKHVQGKEIRLKGVKEQVKAAEKVQASYQT